LALHTGHCTPGDVREKNIEKNLVTVDSRTKISRFSSIIELEISGIQDVRFKYKQNWINHLERKDNTRLPKHALNYIPRGRRDRGRPRKRWQRVNAGTGQATQSMEEDDADDDHPLFQSPH
jgi:hypothetical protein